MQPTYRIIRKIGRNEKCPCTSGRKYKKCCIDKTNVNIYTNPPIRMYYPTFLNKTNNKIDKEIRESDEEKENLEADQEIIKLN